MNRTTPEAARRAACIGLTLAVCGGWAVACGNGDTGDGALGDGGMGGGAAGSSVATAGSSSAVGGASSAMGGASDHAGSAGTGADTSFGGADAAAGSPSDAAGAAGEPAQSCAALLGESGPASTWVFAKPDGTLGYRALTPQGDRILDFSYAGYAGGGIALPQADVVTTLMPSGADDTAKIQAALDAVGKRALVSGLRGAVLLGAGKFAVSGTLHIGESGVALRGSGSGKGGTEVDLTGAPHVFLTATGTGAWKTSNTVHVTDAYVPSGSTSLSVDDATGFAVGDTVLVDRPVTAAWVHFMGMDTLVRDGAPQTWLAVGTLIHADRVITAISGKKLTFDAPLSDSYDAKYVSPPGATVSKYTFAGRISHVA